MTTGSPGTMTAPPRLILPADAYKTDGWFAARRDGVTATDIAKICGLHKYGSAWEVYQDKIGDPLPDDAGEAAELGNLLEPIVADLWSKREQRVIVPASLYCNGEREWMRATPDRLALGELSDPAIPTEDGVAHVAGPLEVKTALGWAHLDWADEGQVPDEHICQIMWQMAVLGCDRGWIAALAGPCLKSYEIQRDQAYIDDLIAVAEQFRQQVAKRIPPAPDGSDRLAGLLSKRWQPDPDKTVVLSPAEFEPLRQARQRAAADEAEAKLRKTEADNAIRILLGDAEAAVVDDEIVATWREVSRAGFSVAPSTYRKLTVKKAK